MGIRARLKYFCLRCKTIKIYHKISWMEFFDRQISGSIRRQILCYAVFVALILITFVIAGWLLKSYFGHSYKDGNSSSGVIIDVIHYFFHAGEWYKEESLFEKIFAGVLSVVGMFTFMGLLVATVANSIQERVKKIKNGNVVYKKIRKHYVIIGYSDLAISLMENIFAKYFDEKFKPYSSVNTYEDFKEKNSEVYQKCFGRCVPRIIVFTNQNIPEVRNKISSYFSKYFVGKIYFYSGNIESFSVLQTTNIHAAREVYILGEQSEDGRDIKNLETVNRISNLCVKSSSDSIIATLCAQLKKRVSMLAVKMCIQLKKNISNSKVQKHAVVLDSFKWMLNLFKKFISANKPLKVYMQFDKLTSYSIIQKLPIVSDFLCPQGSSDMNIFFRPFNFYENTARRLWGYTGINYAYDRLDYNYIENDKYVHLVIMGFNRMGRALFFEALRVCHFPNYREQDIDLGLVAKNKTKITIVDNTLDAQLPIFLAEFPYLDQIADVEITYMSKLSADDEVRSLLINESLNENALLTVAVCFLDPDYSMSVGLSLPHDVYYTTDKKQVKNSDTRILIRQEVQKGLSFLVNRNDTKFKNVKTFGSLPEGIDEKLLCDKMPMCVNAYYDVKYMEHETNQAKIRVLKEYDQFVTDEVNDNNLLAKRTFIDWVTDKEYHDEMMNFAERLWMLISEDFRFANRYQIDMYGTYIKYAGHANLAQMEHLRWNADRSIIGYRDMSKEDIKNVAFQLHKLIVPFNALSTDNKKKKEIEKDEDVINNMHKLINYFHANS